MRIAGVDEAGRGPLAGPLVVAAVVLHPFRGITGLGDSKQLTASRREELFDAIKLMALDYSVVVVEPSRIDALNILHATMWGMREAVRQLRCSPTCAVVDGNRIPPEMPVSSYAIVKGDATEPAIGAASILAKVTRDRLMAEMALEWPQYGFEVHKGYPTPQHLEALRMHGVCPHHRRSYAPVKEAISGCVKTADVQGELLI